MKNNELKIGVTIPVYVSNVQHAMYVRDALRSVEEQESIYEISTCIVVNKFTPEFEHHYISLADNVILNDENNVAAAWNAGVDFLVDSGCDYVIVMNQDVELPVEYVDTMVDFAKLQTDDVILYGTEMGGNLFSCFMLNKNSFDLLKEFEKNEPYEPVPGKFNVHYSPAYFEDNDYHRRAQRATFKVAINNRTQFNHTPSQTIGLDVKLREKLHPYFRANREYYIAKWGGLPTQEKFETPFNGAETAHSAAINKRMAANGKS